MSPLALAGADGRESETCLTWVSILPEILESIRRHFGVAHRVHDIFMAQVVLKGSRVIPIVCELVARRMSEHMRMNGKRKFRGFSSSGDHFQESCGGSRTAALGDEDISRFYVFAA